MTLPVIAEAALRVLDAEGSAGLSMRTVAHELGVGTMSLYRYVADRDQLEAAVVETVLGQIDFALAPRLRWDKRIRVLLERVRATVAEHPALIPLVVSRRHLERSSLQLGEALLAALSEAGFSGKKRVVALRALLSYTMGALQFQHLGPLAGSGTEQIAQLPDADYPLLAETARHAKQVSSIEEFRGGLEILLQGLGAP
ncbi:MAG TPA: TetR/AcrR family transcriptional regulator C-terminal domain-containing protein [Polyangiales bacterium]|nr:TetR/AcrR family transcriptional regulator C-terminal domain-containing protein [Polyangiales bacterium]